MRILQGAPDVASMPRDDCAQRPSIGVYPASICARSSLLGRHRRVAKRASARNPGDFQSPSQTPRAPTVWETAVRLGEALRATREIAPTLRPGVRGPRGPGDAVKSLNGIPTSIVASRSNPLD